MKQIIKDLLYEMGTSNDIDGYWANKAIEVAPELFELEVGVWYIKEWDDKDIDLFLVKSSGKNSITTTNDNFYRNGKILVLDNSNDARHNTTDTRFTIRLANKQEVETALIKEAKRIGFKEGVVIRGMVSGTKITLKHNDFKYNVNRCVLNGCCDIFKKGEWATIIPTEKVMTIAELEKELGYEIKIVK